MKIREMALFGEAAVLDRVTLTVMLLCTLPAANVGTGAMMTMYHWALRRLLLSSDQAFRCLYGALVAMSCIVALYLLSNFSSPCAVFTSGCCVF